MLKRFIIIIAISLAPLLSAGRTDAAGSGATAPRRYGQKELNRTAGLNLYNFEARYYDTALTRFTTTNPLQERIK